MLRGAGPWGYVREVPEALRGEGLHKGGAGQTQGQPMGHAQVPPEDRPGVLARRLRRHRGALPPNRNAVVCLSMGRGEPRLPHGLRSPVHQGVFRLRFAHEVAQGDCRHEDTNHHVYGDVNAGGVGYGSEGATQEPGVHPALRLGVPYSRWQDEHARLQDHPGALWKVRQDRPLDAQPQYRLRGTGSGDGRRDGGMPHNAR
eukprot:GHVL01004339.1.p3 GENE.GHVL01004339.1~~GHVL01004339.1.p3  ORF type:complete len:201 (+),score=19.53 GHVL01004339.1:1557-2159(+)